MTFVLASDAHLRTGVMKTVHMQVKSPNVQLRGGGGGEGVHHKRLFFPLREVCFTKRNAIGDNHFSFLPDYLGVSLRCTYLLQHSDYPQTISKLYISILSLNDDLYLSSTESIL